MAHDQGRIPHESGRFLSCEAWLLGVYLGHLTKGSPADKFIFMRGSDESKESLTDSTRFLTGFGRFRKRKFRSRYAGVSFGRSFSAQA